jgi:heme exporter protein A
MQEIAFTVEGISKIFNRRKIFSDIHFSLQSSQSLAITGKNGSGKSTLVKILSNVLSQTKGTIDLTIGGKKIAAVDRFNYLGFVAPYLQLYDEFSGLENLQLFRNIRGSNTPIESLEELLRRVNLFERKDDFVRTYSSGMKQRLKYAFALLHNPPILILDEPRSNLDAEGITTAYNIIEEQKQRGIVIIATNDVDDLTHCKQIINLDIQKEGMA